MILLPSREYTIKLNNLDSLIILVVFVFNLNSQLEKKIYLSVSCDMLIIDIINIVNVMSSDVCDLSPLLGNVFSVGIFCAWICLDQF